MITPNNQTVILASEIDSPCELDELLTSGEGTQDFARVETDGKWYDLPLIVETQANRVVVVDVSCDIPYEAAKSARELVSRWAAGELSDEKPDSGEPFVSFINGNTYTIHTWR